MVEAVEPQAYVRFLQSWHQVDTIEQHHRDLLDVVETLQGFALPSAVLENEVLRARIPHYIEGGLDTLCASGQVVWIGDGPLGKDVLVRLYLREHVPPAAPPQPALEW